jgi:ribosomal 30S subunit maturation factor RimM
MASIDISDPRRSSYGHDYWLHRCEGFSVQLANRQLGKVTGLRFRASTEPELLEVRTGLLGKRLLIPVEQVQQIEPRTRRIILDASPPVTEPDADPSQSETIGCRGEGR